MFILQGIIRRCVKDVFGPKSAFQTLIWSWAWIRACVQQWKTYKYSGQKKEAVSRRDIRRVSETPVAASWFFL